jgi:hypothetical protein
MSTANRSTAAAWIGAIVVPPVLTALPFPTGQESQATEVVLGHRRRTRWRPWDTTKELIRLLSGVDVHILRGGVPARAPAHP